MPVGIAPRDSVSYSLPGLRERKKRETRAALHAAAMELFASKGYRETRISEIAEAADVSESTFFRYFDNKEGVALEGTRQRLQAIVQAVIARPRGESPIEACLAVSASPEAAQFTPSMREYSEFQILEQLPELASGMVGVVAGAVSELTNDFAERLGRAPNDVVVRLHAHSVISAAIAVIELWLEDPTGVDPELLTREALLHLQRGLR